MIASYKTPINGEDLREQRKEHLILSETLDELIDDYIKFCKKFKKAFEYNRKPSPEKLELLEDEKLDLKERIEKITRQGNKIFEDKNRQKTLMILIDEYLLHFIQESFTGNKSPNTLEKWIGRKKRYIEYLQYESKISDVPLSQVNYRFLDKLRKYPIVIKILSLLNYEIYLCAMRRIFFFF